MPEVPDKLLLRDLELSAERMLHAEREIELLGWLPTAAAWAAIERLGHERARHNWLLRCLWHPDAAALTRR
ncbi:MAG: hypothetical protein HGA45_38790 [Chloroflexales bacterium]|nr:hypothetical protein [Chloroflexales bacterium]